MQLDIFIEGETIDLCIPTPELAHHSDYYKWFNDPYITRYIHSGVFPNTRAKQERFFAEESQERLILAIANKNGDIIGTTSLMHIDYKTRSASLGILMGNPFRTTPLEALEAVALLSEHGFLKLGLERITATQHIALIPWSHRMSLLGYRIEGIERGGFVKGAERADMMRIACTYEDYQRIIEHRGEYWDSQESMLARIKTLQKQESMHKKLQSFFQENQQYYENIFTL